MGGTTPAEPAGGSQPFAIRLAGYASDALRYWEPRRAVYNGALTLVVLLHIAAGWPGVKQKLSVDLALGVFFLAVLANVVYCAAYPVDLFVQFAGLRTAWRRGRVVLLSVGTAFACVITHFISTGLFHDR